VQQKRNIINNAAPIDQPETLTHLRVPDTGKRDYNVRIASELCTPAGRVTRRLGISLGIGGVWENGQGVGRLQNPSELIRLSLSSISIVKVVKSAWEAFSDA
jgi:hypothetical protein